MDSYCLQQEGRRSDKGHKESGKEGRGEAAMASLNASKTAASATTVYNPYRIFQAAQRCMGEPTIVAKVLVELLGEREQSGVRVPSLNDRQT